MKIHPLQPLNDLVMAHRFLYYVKSEPVLSDFDYDKLERFLKDIWPEAPAIGKVGSDLEDNYTAHQKALAKALIGR